MQRMLKTLMLGCGLAALAAAPAAAQWTGCGAGVGGGIMFGEANFGGPVGAGAQGQKAGITVNCDYRMQAFVLGGEVNYDWNFGDLHTLGAKHELSALARMGILTSPTNLLYLAAGWGRTDVGTLKVDGWKLALGDEFRIPNSPIFLDLRATYTRYDEKDISPSFTGVRVDSLEAGARLKLRFGPGMYGTGGQIFDTKAENDPPTIPKSAHPVK